MMFIKNKVSIFLLNNKFNLFLLLLVGVYYLFFINKGIVIADEGYFTTISWLITKGKKPYIDYFLQYPPLFLYLLALCYKIFSNSIIAGRVLSYILYLIILFASLKLTELFNLKTKSFKFFTALIIASFGFPLINIPLHITLCVLFCSLMMIFLNNWIKSNYLKNKYLFLTSVTLGLLFATKQNVGLSYFVFVNGVIFLISNQKIKKRINNIIYLNLIVLIINFLWIYYFFFSNNRFEEFIYFLNFGKRIFQIFPFSYPPPSILLQPTGLFKLLPYYLPILFLLLTIYLFIKTKKKFLLILTLPYVGLFTNIFPVSDLLHLYPFLSLSLLSFIIVSQKTEIKYNKLLISLVIITCLSGYYLSNFREYYRYNKPYRLQNTAIDLPTSKYIKADAVTANSINKIDEFKKSNINKDEDIFVYYFSPIVYFLLEIDPPTDFINLFPGNLTFEEEQSEINNLINKKINYIISEGAPPFDTPISNWINKQEIIFKTDIFYIYKRII